MDALIIVGMFLVNAVALIFLMKEKKVFSGACNVVGLCLAVAAAYQFELVNIIVPLVAVVCVVLIIIKLVLMKQTKPKVEYKEEV